MWESPGFWRDFQGARGKSGKPAFGFPRFPQPRHFHSSYGLGFSPFRSAVSLSLGLLVLLSLLYSIAGYVQFDDHAMVHHAGLHNKPHIPALINSRITDMQSLQPLDLQFNPQFDIRVKSGRQSQFGITGVKAMVRQAGCLGSKTSVRRRAAPDGDCGSGWHVKEHRPRVRMPTFLGAAGC